MLEYTLSYLIVFTFVPFATTLIADAKDKLSTIPWENTFEEAVKKAKEAGKPILLDFFSPT